MKQFDVEKTNKELVEISNQAQNIRQSFVTFMDLYYILQAGIVEPEEKKLVRCVACRNVIHVSDYGMEDKNGSYHSTCIPNQSPNPPVIKDTIEIDRETIRRCVGLIRGTFPMVNSLSLLEELEQAINRLK